MLSLAVRPCLTHALSSAHAEGNEAVHLRALRSHGGRLPAQLGLAARHLRRQLAQARQLRMLPRHLRRASRLALFECIAGSNLQHKAYNLNMGLSEVAPAQRAAAPPATRQPARLYSTNSWLILHTGIH